MMSQVRKIGDGRLKMERLSVFFLLMLPERPAQSDETAESAETAETRPKQPKRGRGRNSRNAAVAETASTVHCKPLTVSPWSTHQNLARSLLTVKT